MPRPGTLGVMAGTGYYEDAADHPQGFLVTQTGLAMTRIK
jgi:hypothetical protein